MLHGSQGRRPLPPLVALVAVCLAAAGSVVGETGDGTAAPDPLAEMGWAVTTGAAPGYVDDAACEFCHDEIWASYQEVAMSRAFYRPDPDRIVEKLGHPFHHESSNRYYEMSFVDGTYRFTRYQLDEMGHRLNEIEQDVDWVLGSGNHSRIYLFRIPAGEIYQLPLAWYGQTGTWGMAPGYDRPFHFGLQRMVRRECMFCHNAYPDVPAGSDAYGQPQVFPEELPSGLGCQRCHGPGARHARLAVSGDGDADELLEAIVNPGKLAPRLRDDVCYGCHMQPSVSLIGVRRFGRPDYSFRPGQPLAGYQVQIDVVEEGQERSDRFEINHHPYRLEQSRCFTESAGQLSCLTCHDPHRKVPPVERAAWYRAKCLGCHELGSVTVHAADDPGDCVPCHMPERRTQDVIRVTMTDHRIARGPFGPELVAPLEERDPILLDATFLHPDRSPTGTLGRLYRAATVVRAAGGVSPDAVESLGRLLGERPLPEIEPWLNLASGQLRQRRYEELESTTDAIFERAPGHPLALGWLGLGRARQGRLDEAIELVGRAVDVPNPRPETLFNLGLLLLQAERFQEARTTLERSVALRPNQGLAWFYLGQLHKRLERPEEAVAAYRRALAVDPAVDRAYVALAETLLDLGERDEALRILGHGARVARDTGMVEEALARATRPAEPSVPPR